MKYWIPSAALSDLVAAVALAGGRHEARTTITTRKMVPVSRGVLGVEALMKAPKRHRGSVQVEGVVSAIAPKQQTLALIDTAEFQKCSTVECAPLALPVRWTGRMPTVTSAVRVGGEIQGSGGKLIFVARTLEKMKPQPRKP